MSRPARSRRAAASPVAGEDPVATAAIADGPVVAETVAAERGGRRHASIERRLPLSMLGLLVPTIAILLLWNHGLVRDELADSAVQRLHAAASEVQVILGHAFAQRVRTANYLGSREAVVRFAAADAEQREALLPEAQKALHGVLRRNSPQVAELWSGAGELLLREVHPPAEPGEQVPTLHAYAGTAPRATGMQPLGSHAGEPFCEVVAEVRPRPVDGADTAPAAGRLVLRVPLDVRREADLLANLILPDATVLLGNRDGSAWTDFAGIVAPPAIAAAGPGGVYTNAEGALRVGAGAAVANTPWLVFVEGDAEPILAPATGLLLRSGALAVVLLVLGGATALWLGRRLTRPLREATTAAEAIASGHYERRIANVRDDELGRLTQAFNVMAEHVERSHRELERRVTARTAHLKKTLVQLRDAQQDLLRKEKLALLGQLAGSVGHELRNPLGVMHNTVHALELSDGGATPSWRELVGVLRRQISLSEKIVTDLLDCARTRSTEPAEVALERLIEEQVRRLGPVTFRIVRNLDPAAGLARADAVHVGQILFNLLTNASQALAQRGDATVVVRLRRGGEHVRLEVEDDGPGVAEAMRARIFEPLVTTRPHGIGLGLAVSRRLAEENGGELLHEVPESGRGARFVLTLPAARHCSPAPTGAAN